MNATATKTRPNTYAGSCSNCHSHVAAGAGVLGGKVGGRWTVRHTTCGASPVTRRPKPDITDGYGRPVSARRSRSCPTDGNCSSYSGRSCGADDCG